MKEMRKKRVCPILSSEDAAQLLPLLDDGIARLNRFKEECTTDEDAEELARKIFRLKRLHSRISRLQAEKPEAGREPEFVELLKRLGTPIDTYGLAMHGLGRAAAALVGQPEIAHTIYYNKESKEVFSCENTSGKIPDGVNLLSPDCPYVCVVPAGQQLTEQEIADRISEAVERNISMALIDARFKSLADHEKIEFLFTIEEGNP